MDVVVQPINYEQLLAWLPDMVLVVDSEVRLQYVNAAAADVLGLDPVEWIGRSVIDLVHPDDVAVVVSSVTVMQGKRLGTPIEIRVRRGDGEWKWLELIGVDGSGVDGVSGLVCVARDLTRRRMWEVSGDDVAKFQQVIQHAPSITLLLDRQGVVTSVNGAFTRLLGHDPTEVVGRTLIGFAAPDGAPALAAAIHTAITSREKTSCEAAMRLATGFGIGFETSAHLPSRPIRFEIVNLLDDPVVGGLVVTAHDVTDLHRARQELEHIARHDSLTGLATRAVLLEQLDAVIRSGQRTAVLFIDLDRFKPVNDLLGHESGDELLKAVADRLRRVVRPIDLVARVGGDEFVVLSTGINDQATANVLAERIDIDLGAPYLLRAGPVRITASIGVALTDSTSTVAGALADADMAMYDVKAGHRGDPERLSPARQLRADERRRLADDLAGGLRRGEIVAYMQPIVDVASGRTIGVEALARWQHPRLGLLSPASFLDVAEDAGLDLALGDAVLSSACAVLARTGADLHLCINLSVAQLADERLCDRLGAILRLHDLRTDQLRVEITEHATLARRSGPGRVSPEQTLLHLHEMGASLALDDFGTGYSSLTHVQRYPLTAVKIDQSFVAGVVDQRQDRAVVAAVVGLAHMLDLQVVGEGVERPEQLEALAELGCHAVQGYLIAEPLDAAAFNAWATGPAARDWRLGSTSSPAPANRH
jgi:diguanylate cyclase (GGDEF)-like protein/PAS domain S-box-containing protein